MSKLLVKSKTFLPMVIKKSPIETMHISETQPIVATKLDSTSIKEVPSKNIPTGIGQKPEDGYDNNKEGTLKTTLHKNIDNSSGLVIGLFQKRTIYQAIMMDVMQVQGWLVRLLARGHTWVFRREVLQLEVAPQAPPSSMATVFLEGRPRVKEEEPNCILPEHSKTKTNENKQPENYVLKKEGVESKTSKKSDSKSPPTKSHIVDNILERTPEWQKSISANLGALQKKVFDKLPK